jgi:hypothetical protein
MADMTKASLSLLILATALSLVVFAAVPAIGAEMPKELRGSWCHIESSSTKTSYVKCKKGEEDLVIARDGLCLEDGCCDLLNVRKQGKHNWIIKERCTMTGDGTDGKGRIVTGRNVRNGIYLYVYGE